MPNEKIFALFHKKIDFLQQIVYNGIMEKIERKTAIIGGGASGLILASLLAQEGEEVLVLERGERVGKKLSATGNGQGNVSNVAVKTTEYFSSTPQGTERARTLISQFDERSLSAFFEKLGVLVCVDERGRIYPTGKQASSLTDALRFYLSAFDKGIKVRTNAYVTKVEKRAEGFLLTAKTADGEKNYQAQNVVLCTGGKVAKNFGTDGNGYLLATSLGHTLTPLFPSLVQLKTETAHTKTLKGIRVENARLTASYTKDVKRENVSLQGDVIFTDYGVSGDGAFRISAFIADKIQEGVQLSIDFLPDYTQEQLFSILSKKRNALPKLEQTELLCGIVNNQVGRAIMKRANGDIDEASRLIKAFTLNVSGTLGFDYAQVTKGGVSATETDENLQSKIVKNLYFAGEILDIDGQCGGYNLQWAYSSACAVARAILQKGRGQV